MAEWQPSYMSQNVRASVVDDIANYQNYAVLGTAPHQRNAPAVHRIYQDACCAKPDEGENADFQVRADHRRIWATAWLIACGEWKYDSWSI